MLPQFRADAHLDRPVKHGRRVNLSVRPNQRRRAEVSGLPIRDGVFPYRALRQHLDLALSERLTAVFVANSRPCLVLPDLAFPAAGSIASASQAPSSFVESRVICSNAGSDSRHHARAKLPCRAIPGNDHWRSQPRRPRCASGHPALCGYITYYVGIVTAEHPTPREVLPSGGGDLGSGRGGPALLAHEHRGDRCPVDRARRDPGRVAQDTHARHRQPPHRGYG